MIERKPAEVQYVVDVQAIRTFDEMGADAKSAIANLRDLTGKALGSQWIYGGGAGGWSPDPDQIIIAKYSEVAPKCAGNCDVEVFLDTSNEDDNGSVEVQCKRTCLTEADAISTEANCIQTVTANMNGFADYAVRTVERVVEQQVIIKDSQARIDEARALIAKTLQ